jgi:hypothetical protein
MCLVLWSLVLGQPAQAAGVEHFKTPSGNIICDLTEEIVQCVIKSGLEPSPPRIDACNGGDPVSNRVELSATGIAEPTRCAGDPGPLVYETDAIVLAEGSAKVQGEIGCAAYKFGLVCVNSKGHGFLLSRALVRYF